MELANIGDFYYGSSYIRPPSWVKKFFDISPNATNNPFQSLFNSNSKGVLLVKN